MKWREGQIDGVIVRPAERHADARGWLAEIYRSDEMPADLMPLMGYVSVTHPGFARGPHEHREQTDTFGFVGPGTLKVRLWDPRPESPTCGVMQTVLAGADRPTIVSVPPRVVHGYANESTVEAWVLNFPNRLYRGAGRHDPADEIRHEDAADAGFSFRD